MMSSETQKDADCCVVSTGNDTSRASHYAFRTRVKEITPKEFESDTKTYREEKRLMQMM